jgi:hypothetical protein
MSLSASTAGRAVSGIVVLGFALALAGCSDVLGDSPPHAAPSDPFAEAGDGFIELTWGAVTGADTYTILWTDSTTPNAALSNKIHDITTTSYTHTGLTNLRTYRYRILGKTKGGGGPESLEVSATPGPVPGPVEWVAVTSQDPGHTVYFGPATGATRYRVYFATTEEQLEGRRPFAFFEETDASPLVRAAIPVTASLYYRVIALNDTRIGIGGPVAVSSSTVISEHDLEQAGAAVGDANDDGCLDLPTANGTVEQNICRGSFTAVDLATAGLADLLAAGRTNGDSRFADLNGDLVDDLFSNTLSPAGDPASIALFHANQGTGVFQTSAGVSALGIGGFGGTLLVADFDNDGDLDVFAPNDHTQGDGARNWLLQNDGAGVLTDVAAAAGVDANPAGADYVPRGGQAVDFNEDGFIDLLFGSRLLLNDGDGTFSDGSAAAGMPVRADQGLRLMDVDLDGDLDLLHHDGSVTRLYRNTAGVFDAGTIVAEDSTPTFGYGLAACDMNIDGFEDVYIANNDTGTSTGVPKLLVNVNGTLMPSAVQREVVVDSDDLVDYNDLFSCADVSGDGRPDTAARWGDGYRLLRGASSLSTRIRIRVLGAGGERNQQGRIVRVVPQDAPNRIMTRVIESGSGLRSQGGYDLQFAGPWPGDYDVTVEFAAGSVTTTAEAGDDLTIYADGRVETGLR